MSATNLIDTLNSARSIPEAFFLRSKSHPDEIVYSQSFLVSSDTRTDNIPIEKIDRTWRSKTYSEVSKRVLSIAHYLSQLGLKKGDKVAIISNTRPEWLEADLAVLSLGGVVVSVYQSLLAIDIGYIIYDSGAKIVFAENDEQVEKLQFLAKNKIEIPGTEDRDPCAALINIEHIITFEESKYANEVTTLNFILEKTNTLDKLDFSSINRQDLAALVYTSGTTGPPKGVMQTHGNHLSNVRQASQAKLYSDNSIIILILPLAHSFAKLMGYIGFITGAEVRFPVVVSTKSSKLNANSLTKDIQVANADIVPLVPRMIEKMQEGVERRAEGKTVLAKLLQATFSYAAIGNRNIFQQVGYFLTSPLRATIKKRLFGNRLKFVVSGGAKLSPEVGKFFDQLNIPILEGYGLTETCVATNVNRLSSNRIGTVGPVLAPDIEIKIDQDGEILYRGPNITQGYYQRPTATAASWDKDGWFHTGDLGEIDGDGYLKITGRKKELIVTAGGKKIAPDNIEQKLRAISLVSQAVLVGEGRPYCCAILTLNIPVVKEWLNNQGHKDLLGEQFSASIKQIILAEVWKHVEVVNQGLASFESIKRIHILEEDFTIENGLLTPTLKVKRKEVTKRFEQAISSIYEKGSD
jgi:long-chain acyl-CoA synthetase